MLMRSQDCTKIICTVTPFSPECKLRSTNKPQLLKVNLLYLILLLIIDEETHLFLFKISRHCSPSDPSCVLPPFLLRPEHDCDNNPRAAGCNAVKTQGSNIFHRPSPRIFSIQALIESDVFRSESDTFESRPQPRNNPHSCSEKLFVPQKLSQSKSKSKVLGGQGNS